MYESGILFIPWHLVRSRESGMKARSLRHVVGLAIAFSLFQKGSERRDPSRPDPELEDDDAPGRIRCPECEWQPNPSSLWYCADSAYPERFFGGCATAWNTFDTRGKCPGCGHLWRWTVCLSCGIWSLHEHWYPSETP